MFPFNLFLQSFLFVVVLAKVNSKEDTDFQTQNDLSVTYPGYGVTWVFIEDGNGTYKVGYLGEDKSDKMSRIYIRDPPSKDNVIFRLYTKSSPDFGEIVTKSNVTNSNFDPKRKTKFVTHGWMSDGNSQTCLWIKDGYLKDNALDYNVFTVDWSYFSRDFLHYFNILSYLNDIGAFYRDFIEEIIESGLNPEDIHLIGHSLGAHLSYFAAKSLPQKIGRISGLDPALPGFNEGGKRLSKEGADFVDVIHTSGGTLGITKPVGHADFYPYGGIAPQPGCDILKEFVDACSHGKSWKYYASSLKNETLQARKCENYEIFKTTPTKCSDEIILMGEETPSSARGSFFF